MSTSSSEKRQPFGLAQRIFRTPFTLATSAVNKISGVPAKNEFLEGNYAPVKDEIFAKALTVEGAIPSDLRGEFVRNGPNPKHIPTGQYHWFDGDGMLHGVRITPDGTVNYVNRYTITERLKVEDANDGPVFVKLGDLNGKAGLAKLLFSTIQTKLGLAPEKTTFEWGTANTSVAFHDRRLLALVENDLPYEVRMLNDGLFETLGQYSYDGKMDHPFSAHPKVDPVTGEMMTFGYRTEAPFCSYSVVAKSGEIVRSYPIPLPAPIMMHDFAITEKYSIFMDLPLRFEPQGMATYGDAFRFRDNIPSRFGILPRHAEDASNIRWFESSSCYIFHTANAWEDGDEVVLVACRLQTFHLSNFDPVPAMHMYRFNMVTGCTTELTLVDDDFCCEFPTVNPSLLGRKTKFAWAAWFPVKTEVRGCVKFDLETRTVVGRITLPEGCTGGEFVFVPKRGGAHEDDGYLLTFMYERASDSSSFVVFDAKTMDSSPLAKVPLPQRVPYGFHGIWVPESDFQSQRHLAFQ